MNKIYVAAYLDDENVLVGYGPAFYNLEALQKYYQECREMRLKKDIEEYEKTINAVDTGEIKISQLDDGDVHHKWAVQRDTLPVKDIVFPFMYNGCSSNTLQYWSPDGYQDSSVEEFRKALVEGFEKMAEKAIEELNKIGDYSVTYTEFSEII